uniref:Ig-like domain-containing protein n=1 Tax=Acanthochromis polyacanthus TaxID=80966 RepID=A0A3Q1F7K8_9TELE
QSDKNVIHRFCSHVPPCFVEELSSLEVLKGSTAVFACKVAGSRPLNVTWFRDRKPIKSSQKHTIVDGENTGLRIQDCQMEDVGTYRCVVANEVGSCAGFAAMNVTIFIFCEQSPSFTKTPSPVEGIKGKDASLQCEMYGTAPFQVNWYKDRRPLKESRKYKMVSVGSSATLHVMKLELDDAGVYECMVSNNVGSETCRTTMTLKG